MQDANGYGLYLACRECWAGMTPFERILLAALATPRADGGLGVGDAVEQLADTIDKGFRALHGHSAAAICSECSPDEHHRLIAQQAERLRRQRRGGQR